MKNELIKPEIADTDTSSAENKLIHLDIGSSREGRVNDINRKIGLLEENLLDMQNELEQINQSVETGLDRLSDNGLDLTSKVSETYKRLGEIDTRYKALTSISENIDDQVKKLTTEISGVAEQSSSELSKLEQSSVAQTTELNEQHELLVARVNELVKHSREASDQLAQDIEKNTRSMLSIETDLSERITHLTEATEQADKDLSEKVDGAFNEIEASKARILQMQNVDEALAKRADILENSASELLEKTVILDSSVSLLDARTDELRTSVIEIHDRLEEHSSLIGGLQRNAAQMSKSIKALFDTERLHFRVTTIALVVLLLLTAGLYFFSTGRIENNAAIIANRTGQVDTAVAALETASQNNAGEIAQVNADLNRDIAGVAAEVAAVNEKLVDVNDQMQSLDGRLTAVNPFSELGKDNVIHGPQWLAKLPDDNYVIKVASVRDKNEMYDIAQRYNHYLKDTLSYFSYSNAGRDTYVLIAGNYSNVNKASSVLDRMPYRINFERPVIYRVKDLKAAL